MADYPDETKLFIKYVGDPLWTSHIVYASYGPGTQRYVILSPQGEFGTVCYGDRSIFEMDRVAPIGGGLAFGMPHGTVPDDFQRYPTPAETDAILVEAKSEVARILANEALVPGPAIGGLPAAAPRLPLAPGALRAPVPLPGIPGGPGTLVPAPAAPGQGSSSLTGAAPAPGGGSSGGLASLAAALGNPSPGGDGSSSTDPNPSNARVDARILSVQFDNQGHRYRSFRDATMLAENVKWEDWPVPGGILTVVWCMQFMLNRAGSPTAWHALWRSLGRLNEQDYLVQFHDSLCQIVETAACYDQLDCPALASMELVYRQIQICEERLKEKFSNQNSESSYEIHLMAGTACKSQLCVCPALSAWMSVELSKRSAIDKERRKAREERVLLSKEKGKKEKQTDGG